MFKKIQILNHNSFNLFNTYYILLCVLLFIIPLSASSKNLEVKAWVNKETKKSLSSNPNQFSLSNNTASLSVSKPFNNIASKIMLNLSHKQKFTLDHSFIEYRKKNNTYGAGMIKSKFLLMA